MEFNAVVEKRYSCRAYKPDVPSNELIESIIGKALLAPSAVNIQPYHVLILNTEPALEKARKAYNRPWFACAPVVLIVSAIQNQGWVRNDGTNHAIIDTSIFIDHLTLVATSVNLATCWVCNFEMNRLKQLFVFPEGFEPIALVPLGYPATEEIPAKKRHALNKIITYNKF
ncbi:MAG: nitroreductase [Bacteroidetes bacterium HGW-Bacteroidetes-4]|jgi:nitroreductase|nr:MAG: nitroreductase [Bacteroidetes bacterium HGW-Bacteroidetes-4]